MAMSSGVLPSKPSRSELDTEVVTGKSAVGIDVVVFLNAYLGNPFLSYKLAISDSWSPSLKGRSSSR